MPAHRIRRAWLGGAGLLLCAWLTGCAAPQRTQDHSAFIAADPASILVLPPLNDSPEIEAGASVLSHATYPLAEAGYYVMPVALVHETFRQNGLEIAADIHAVPAARLREIFGADAALYITIDRYGTTYQVIDSATVVSARARLVDLRTGNLLWVGQASASSKEGSSGAGGNLTSMLLTALVNQIIQTSTEAAHGVAGVATRRLLAAGGPDGLRFGPRSPLHGKP
ncbi:DUF799 domain-containing protein [Comamonas endophytica]|uniref:DUF799 domain-containing protein n=1 Tax=Comamonas endophytica TaxID=2949090 RepID=A0ABY6G720_9BURK|nr:MULTISPECIES: DUF799 domain-containing protein [unclassified Acidovorax]MCD2511428.1 DUF799 domain-containing protein [Acidovorax sp. D4N7]UYG50819.1 DUF799 domain-containing protein [Acidovorax sp. 5MLIR]